MHDVDHQFELVGDPEELTDDFFDALAALLLEIEARESRKTAEVESE